MAASQILVVEDDAHNARSVQKDLERLGYRVPDIAVSGEDAVKKVLAVRPDLVLMDIKLGDGIDGVETAEKIQAQLDIPVVYLTAYADEELLQRAKSTEPFGYILKPIQIQELRSNIEMALYKHRLGQKLKKSEARYRAISELSTDFAYALQVEPDRSLLMEWATEALTDITGFTPAELGTKGGIMSLVYPDDLPLARRHMRILMKGKVPNSCELRIVTKGGDLRWIRCSSQSVWDEVQKRVIRIYGAGQDITEYKRVEEALKRSESEKAAILNSMSDLVAYLDTDLRVVWANRAAGESVGLMPEQLVGRYCYELRHRRSSPCPACPIVTVLETGQPQQGEVTSPDGKMWFLRGYPIKDDAGNIVSIVEVGSDVTSQKQAEAALRESNARLEQAMADLKATQQQVLQQERLAAVGQLAAGMAHDFNNMLTSMIGFAELMLMNPDMPAATRQHHLERILTQGHRGAHLIRQVLDFSRTSICCPGVFDFVPFLKESLQKLEQTIPDNVHIDLKFDLDQCQIKADPGQIQQLLTNLVLNACDAMPAGGALKLVLSTLILGQEDPPPDPQVTPGQWVVLSVSDTGKGIAVENLSRIFEPFFTTKGVGQGTGLGLAQVYGIVKQHAGCIKVESQEKQGTTVTVYLPALLPEKKSTLPPQDVALPLGQGEIILLVEDEPDVLEVEQIMLKSLGYRVLAAGNGKEALDLYALYSEEIALILSDIEMPEMDGVTLFQTLKEQYPEVKVVMMTGYPLLGEKAKALIAQGVVACLQKPIKLSALNRIISEGLRMTPTY